jgi:hypothetical protein
MTSSVAATLPAITPYRIAGALRFTSTGRAPPPEPRA